MGISRGNITTNIIKNGLVFNMDPANRACYPQTGTLATDTVNSITGSLNNNVTFTPVSASSWYFDGTDDFINLLRPSELNFTPQTDAFSISSWIRTSGAGTIYSYGAPSSNSSTQIKITIRGDNYYPEMVLGGTVSAGSSALNNNTWHNIIVTVPAASSGAKMYLNGSIHISNGSLGTTTSTEPGLIGARTDGSGFEFTGYIGNIQIYNRALSAEEVLRNYNGLRGRFGL